MRNLVKSVTGISILGMLIAMGIAGLMLFSQISAVKNIQQSFAKTQQTFDLGMVRTEISRLLNNPVACKNTVPALAFGPAITLPITDIRDANNQSRYSNNPNQVVGASGLYIESMSLGDYRPYDSLASADRGKAVLTITYTFPDFDNFDAVNSLRHQRNIDLEIRLGSTGLIDQCKTTAKKGPYDCAWYTVADCPAFSCDCQAVSANQRPWLWNYRFDRPNLDTSQYRMTRNDFSTNVDNFAVLCCKEN